MKGLEKLTSVRLAELLSQKGLVPADAITDALYAQDKLGEPFVQVLINSGHMAEWDLAKLVTENFQLPFMQATDYSVSEEARKRLPKEVLFENLLVPLDVFDDVISVLMPVMTPYEKLLKIQKEHSCDLFPYVGLVSESTRILGELFPDFNDWFEAEKKRRELESRKSQEAAKPKADWMSVFDAGEQAIQSTLQKPRKS
ncbi:MAG: hypothetical protein Fur0037_00510 [Planctomycetota bacterium]